MVQRKQFTFYLCFRGCCDLTREDHVHPSACHKLSHFPQQPQAHDVRTWRIECRRKKQAMAGGRKQGLLNNNFEQKIHFNSQELAKLKTALTGTDNGRLEDLSKMTGKTKKESVQNKHSTISGFHHTGPLENLNSLGNKYANKAYVYGQDFHQNLYFVIFFLYLQLCWYDSKGGPHCY